MRSITTCAEIKRLSFERAVMIITGVQAKHFAGEIAAVKWRFSGGMRASCFGAGAR